MNFKKIEELGLSESLDTNNSEIQTIMNLFKKLEKDSDPTDTTVIDTSYFSTFLFCNPDNSDAIKKEDFLKTIPLISRKYAEMGFKKKRIQDLKVFKLDKHYFLIQVIWQMFFTKNEKEEIYDNIRATYILRKENDEIFKIILQLDHQKLEDIVE